MRSLLPLILSIGLGCAKKPEPLKIENSETEIDATKTEEVTTEVESQQANEVVTDEDVVVEKDVEPLDIATEDKKQSGIDSMFNRYLTPSGKSYANHVLFIKTLQT